MKAKKSHTWLLVALASLGVGSIYSIFENYLVTFSDSLLPETSLVLNFRRPGSITILSTKGKIIQKIGPATRLQVEPKIMPNLIKKAFVAAEDRRFYHHKGIDVWGINRALLNNIKKNKVTQGGSTITQQLARTVYLNQDRTVSRKLKEAALAFKLERQLNKEEILEQYLNNVYLGAGAYGIADASWVYFKKKPELLKLEEIALIAGLPPAPSVYSPIINPDLALKRRSIVLNRMLAEKFISKKDYNLAIKSPLRLRSALPKYLNSAAPFFTTWVNQKLPELLTPEQLELGGITIKTSLNLDWQEKAQTLIRNQPPVKMEGAMISIEPTTGLVRVLVGGKDFNTNQFNRATQALRSPGSTFKLFPYAAALSSGLKPEQMILDKPRCWNGYCPKNFGRKYMGKISISDSFKFSSNTVAVKLLEQVGFNKVISTANGFGIGTKRKLEKYYPLAIGAFEQTVIDMTAAYAAVANRGIYIEPSPFEEIRGPGDTILWEYRKDNLKPTRAISENVADTLNWMLQKVVEEGTGKVAALGTRPVAGKTGTSEKGRDLWFIGSIPQLTTGVWFGYDSNAETKRGSGESAWVWKNFMSQIEDEFQILNFAPRQYSR